MRMNTWMLWMVIGTTLVLVGCKTDKVTETHHPAKLVETGQEGIMKVVLEEKALARLGLETAPVREEMVNGERRLVVPYGAIMYDTKGDTWTFINPEPRTFVRHKITVATVRGEHAILTEGPSAGTLVVIVGATELMGAEHKYGH